MRNVQWLPLALVLPFAKGCVYPGWSSAAELAFCLALVGFLTYFKPRPPLEEKRLAELEAKCASLHETISALNMKLGFRTR